MRQALPRLLFVFLLFAGSTSASLTASVVFPTGTPQQTGDARETPRVQTVQFQSKLMGRTLPYNVILPVDYDQPSDKPKRYPVLFLLHGLFGHYNNWTDKTELSDHVRQYKLIIITPEGNNGWYTDSATTPADKYETYFIEELIPDVERRYRTIQNRNGRAIAGLSMGGYGALKFGVKYPDKFFLAGSMSGATGAASWSERELQGLQVILRTIAPVFGNDGSATRSANDLYKLYGGLTPEGIAALPFLYLDCGTEDHLLQSNRTFVDVLLTRKIPHEYRQLPGRHDWVYWDKQVQELLQIVSSRTPMPASTN